MDNTFWKCDVAVVGGGPAGLAAAIRIRHVKENDGLPLSVAVFDPSPVGGLLKTGGKRLVTGPSLTVESSQLLADLVADIERYEIPVLPYRVEEIEKSPTGTYLLHVADETVVEAEAVVMATGCRPMGNELDKDQDGIYVSYRGVSFLGNVLERARSHADGRPIAVVTNHAVKAILPLFWRHEADYLFIVPPGDKQALSGLPGTLVSCTDWQIKAQEDDAFILSLDTDELGVVEPWAGAILLDYVSYQKAPLLPRFVGFELERRTGGVPQVDEFLASSEAGLYFAGDVTARYGSVTAALADGIAAAVGAYGYAFRRRFGQSPPMFQTIDRDGDERFLERELPVLYPDYVMQWLQTPPTGHPLALTGNMTLADAVSETGFSIDQVYALTYQAIRDRYVTILPKMGSAEGH